ncbi:MAG: methylenetetrahydrofolate reductase [Alphaproteobacteria bacterium]|nr:methylenetetrahydrofolate reductase [Alphaproteobacteria bacterium]
MSEAMLGGASRTLGQLERTLKAGWFAVTAETSPPDSADPDAVLRRTGCLKGLADAVNVLDGAGARVHLSPLAAAAILVRAEIDPVLQFTMRDRNRLALEADVLGAAALGVRNILSLTGDAIDKGDQPDAKPVFDLKSGDFMAIVKRMRDEGELPSGRKLEAPPHLLIGAAAAPSEPKPGFDAGDIRAKLGAGADFIQTQFCFDFGMLRRYMARLDELGYLGKIPFLIGIGPLRSAKSARWMNENLFGVHIPDNLIARLEGATDQAKEGRTICIELIQELREVPGVSGVHLMAPHGEEACARVIDDSGILKGRSG